MQFIWLAFRSCLVVDHGGLLAVHLNCCRASNGSMHTMYQGCWWQYGFIWPLLKHGLRSLTCVLDIPVKRITSPYPEVYINNPTLGKFCFKQSMYVLQGKGRGSYTYLWRRLLPPTLKYINNPTLGKFCFKANIYVLQGRGEVKHTFKEGSPPHTLNYITKLMKHEHGEWTIENLVNSASKLPCMYSKVGGSQS